ncbi:hypothetical protein ABTA52_20615, partial [Acinetobacter baumannii]
MLEAAAAHTDISIPQAGQVRSVAGLGIEGHVDGRALCLGSSRWMQQLQASAPALQARADQLQAQGRTLSWL